MDSFTIPVMIALFATVVILFAGIVSMVRGGEFDQRHSVQLMYTRVSFQAVAIILIIVAVLYAARLA
jgi:Hypoxia induced protein conserved region